MKIILNNFAGSTTFERALRELTEGAETLSVAVSYLQVGGCWNTDDRRVIPLAWREAQIKGE